MSENGARELLGYAAYCLIPFTYDLKPTLVLKELFVRKSYRSSGVGTALLDRLLGEAQHLGCGQLKWAVLPTNFKAKAFYVKWGGAREDGWEFWHRDLTIAHTAP